MPRLVYRAAARRAIAEIAAYIERESKSRAIADDFINNLTDYCEHIAKLPGQMGARGPNFAATFAAPRSATTSFFCAMLMKTRPAAICTSRTLCTARATWTLIFFNTGLMTEIIKNMRNEVICRIRQGRNEVRVVTWKNGIAFEQKTSNISSNRVRC